MDAEQPAPVGDVVRERRGLINPGGNGVIGAGAARTIRAA